MTYPEWTTANLIFYSILAIAALGVGPAVYYGDSLMMQYGKFRNGGGIHPRLGMFILYFTPIMALYISARDYLTQANLIQWLVLASVGVHFAKRVLESLFLHRYSGPVQVVTTALIASFYSLAAFLIGWLNRSPIPAIDSWFLAGISLFLIGLAGNFYHHKLLADLRKNSLEYFIPTGGLFERVVCPHYLFEILTWTGIFLMSRHLAALLVLAIMTMYLVGRSLGTLKWYHDRFQNFPTDRKALLPYVL